MATNIIRAYTCDLHPSVAFVNLVSPGHGHPPTRAICFFFRDIYHNVIERRAGSIWRPSGFIKLSDYVSGDGAKGGREEHVKARALGLSVHAVDFISVSRSVLRPLCGRRMQSIRPQRKKTCTFCAPPVANGSVSHFNWIKYDASRRPNNMILSAKPTNRLSDVAHTKAPVHVHWPLHNSLQ